jgi:hypothetical protein
MDPEIKDMYIYLLGNHPSKISIELVVDYCCDAGWLSGFRHTIAQYAVNKNRKTTPFKDVKEEIGKEWSKING